MLTLFDYVIGGTAIVVFIVLAAIVAGADWGDND